MAQFARCHHHAKIAAEPEGLLLVGIAGMGKTTLLKHYMCDFKRKMVTDRTLVPVLATRIQVPASPKSLVTALLTSLGDPLPEKGSTVSQTLRLYRLMNSCEVELVILDEFQHFIDRDSKKVLKTTSDWLKNLMDETGKPIILAGMPYAHAILDAEGNEQLRRRFSTRLSLEPFSWETYEQRQDFRRFMELIDEKLPLNERSELSDESMSFRFFDATGGVISKIMVLIRRATAIAVELSQERLNLEILNRAYHERLAADLPKKLNPFDEFKSVVSKTTQRDKTATKATNSRSKAIEKKLSASDVLS